MHRAPSREVCFLVLHRLFLLCDRQSDLVVAYRPEGREDALSDESFQAAIEWLRGEHLLRYERGPESMCLTALGRAVVERALASPEASCGVFPPLSQFYGIGDTAPIGLCNATVRVWLDQLGECAEALDGALVESCDLDRALRELDACLDRSGVDPHSLRVSLQQIRREL